MFSRTRIMTSTGTYSGNVGRLKKALAEADTVVIGAGAGLSTSAGFVYSGERFEKYFFDFAAKYHFSDMYSGGFYPYTTQEEFWAYWSRYIWINRYMDAPKPVYDDLLAMVRNKDYFVITQTWITASRKPALTRTACSTRREITACSSAASRVTTKHTKTKKPSERWCLRRAGSLRQTTA